MLGGGISSNSIWTAFNTVCSASVRKLRHSLGISWLRNKDENLDFATVGTSVVGGTDIVQGQFNDITPPDVYDYFNETPEAIRIEYDRELEEPLGGISFAQLDVTLDNTNKRFTPDYNNTIGTALLPNRPIQAHIGFEVKSQDKTVTVFKGLTDRPQEQKKQRISRIHCFDYLVYLNELDMDSSLHSDYRSDQLIAEILAEAGVTADQYILDEGLNTIGFAWFKKGQTAGERIRRICEAEGGHFYQDELGYLRFENRRHYATAPHTQLQWTFEADDILDWEEVPSVRVINKCVVTAKPREVQNTSEIWKSNTVEDVATGETKEIWADLDNPVNSIETPIEDTDYKANTASDGTGTDVTSSVDVSVTSFAERIKLSITNNYGSKVYMTYLRLRGDFALITNEIQERYTDQDSIDKYDEHELEIENDFIDDESFAYFMSRAIVSKYKEPLKRIRIMVRGIPQLQLKDKVKVYDQDVGTYTDYRIMRIVGDLRAGEFTQWLTLREITENEADNWAIVGTSEVGGSGLVGI